MNELLALTISLLDGKETYGKRRVYPDSHILIQVVFHNKDKRSVMLLKQFEPTPIFFSLNIVKEDGTIIDIPGAGKIAMDRMEYVKLNTNEMFAHNINIATVLTEPLVPDKYTLSVEYHNQYGGDACFTGYLMSNTVDFEIVSEETYHGILG